MLMFILLILDGLAENMVSGRRISLHYTRQMVNQAIYGKLKNAEYTKDSTFGLSVPVEIEDVPKLF